MSLFKGVCALVIFLINTLIMVPLLLLFSVIKLLLPIEPVRQRLSQVLVLIAETWITVNHRAYQFIHGKKIHVVGDVELTKKEWYLVISNHQSTADIPVIQGTLNKKAPFLRFFLKQELIWVPLLGLAWWALDFPFMRRYTREYLEKNPHMQGKDLEKTRASCEKFRAVPTSIFNFVEGTRFSAAKWKQQESEFRHVLKPKAGGVGYVLETMGQQLSHLLLVTVKYDPRVPGIWDYICGRVKSITVYLEKVDIPEHLVNKSYHTDMKFRQELFDWLRDLWHKVDSNLVKNDE